MSVINTNNNEENYFKDLEDKLQTTRDMRDNLSKKLNEIVDSIKFDFTDKLSVNQSKIGVLSTFTNLLNDIDNQAFGIEKVKLSKKDKDNDSKYSELLVQYLSKLNVNETRLNNVPEINEEELYKLQEDIEVLEGEIE